MTDEIGQIIPDITIPVDDAYLEELDYRATTAHALADVLWKACQGPQKPTPETIGVVLSFLVEGHLDTLVDDIRGLRLSLRFCSQGRAS
jgi:hypothetical protein